MIEDCTLFAEHPSDISKGKLAEILNEHSFAIIQGIIQPKSIVRAKEKLRDHFSAANDHPATGEAPQELLSNFQKLSIGGAAHSGVYRPRCMRTFYNPLWAPDCYGMREIFRKAAQTRNAIYGWDLDYCIDEVKDGFWTAARITTTHLVADS